MSKKDAMDALLFGSYFAGLPVGRTKVVPDLSGTTLSTSDISEAAKELISQGLITPMGSEVVKVPSPFRCSYEITPKGKNALGDLEHKAELGLFTIVIATGGSKVNIHEEKHQTSNVVTFEQNMIKQIENAKTTDQEKEAAKSKLKEFLAHPLLGTVVGAALGALLKSS